MKNFSLAKTLLFSSTVLFVGCSQHEDSLIEKLENEYTVNWIRDFGIIDANQDWNMATQIKVNISHPSIKAGGYAELYTSNPIGGGLYLGRISQDNKEIKVDMIKGAKSLYVKTYDATGRNTASAYVDINNGQAIYSGAKVRSRDGECNATVASTVTVSRRIPDPSYNLEAALAAGDAHYWEMNDQWKWVNAYGDIVDNYPEGDFTQYNKQRLFTQTFAHITGNPTSTVTEMKIKDLLPIVGDANPQGKFKEGEDNRELYKDVFARDVTFKAAGGPIDVKFQFGGTAFHNLFGYYYWQENEDPLKAVKYILMEDGLPQDNVMYGDADTQVENGMSWPSIITAAASNAEIQEKFAVATKYNLVYFGGAKPSYDFPKGTNIAFFMISAGNSTGHFPEEEQYLDFWLSSVSEHNLVNGKKFVNSSAQTLEIGEVSAVTYKAAGNVVLGFEDGVDKDMNDVLFFLEGVEGTGIKEVVDEGSGDTNTQGWIIACEDLGSTEDYDFNDIVFRVSYILGEDHVHFYPLAAGGVLSAKIYHTDSGNRTLLGEIHKILTGKDGVNGYQDMLNTTGYRVMGEMIEVPITGEYSITTAMGGFSIEVERTDGQAVEIKAPKTGAAPQMMCLPDGWQWPLERVNIQVAYPDFSTWSENKDGTGWINNRATGKTVSWK